VICHVKLFAAARQFAGTEAVTLDLPEGSTVAELRAALVVEHPALAELMPSAMIAINTAYAGNSEIVPTEAEVAVIPPVSGG
jgi:molybdopterin converting factor subunit 1